MTNRTPSQIGLARWLLSTQLDAAGAALAAPQAAERVFSLLSMRLAVVFTLAGFEALVMRAVHIAEAEFPFLQRVATAPGAHQLAARLRDSADGMAASQAAEGLLATLSTLIALLVTFVGEDLTWRLLRDVWPELPVPQPTFQPPSDHVEAHP